MALPVMKKKTSGNIYKERFSKIFKRRKELKKHVNLMSYLYIWLWLRYMKPFPWNRPYSAGHPLLSDTKRVNDFHKLLNWGHVVLFF